MAKKSSTWAGAGERSRPAGYGKTLDTVVGPASRPVVCGHGYLLQQPARLAGYGKTLDQRSRTGLLACFLSAEATPIWTYSAESR